MARPGTKRIEYLAGVIDGEGAFMWANTPRIAVSNTYPGMLEELKAAFGGTVYLLKKATKTHRTCFQWRVSGEDARSAIKQLIPHLDEKLPQAKVLLLLWDLRKVPGCITTLNAELKRLKRIDYGTDSTT